MITNNRIFVVLALIAMAYWCNPIQAQTRTITLYAEKGPHDIIQPPDEGEQDTGVHQGDTSVKPSSVAFKEKPSILLFPNPARSYFMVQDGHQQLNHAFRLSNASGQAIREFYGNEQVSISDLPAGIYFVIPLSAESPFRTTKLMILD